MKSNIRIILLLIGVLFAACYEDKGNYDLVDYNRIVKITQNNALSKYSITLGDTVRIVPVITWKYPDRDTITAFEFTWKTRWDGDTISKERVLEYIPQECGTFNVYLYVLEKETGVISRNSWQVKVNTPYLEGWLIASNINEQPSLSYIRRDSWKDDENKTHYFWTDFVNLYATLHSDASLGSEKMIGMSSYTVDSYDDELIVFQEGGKATVLNGLDFGKSLNVSSEFPNGVYPAGFIPKDFKRGGACDFILGEAGELYWRRNLNLSKMYHEVAFMDVPIYFPKGAKISHFFDIDVYRANFILMYDELYKRFLACYTSYNSGNSYLGGKIDIINTYDPSEFANILDLNGYKVIYCGDHTNGKNYVNILKEENTGKYLYQAFQFSGSMTNLTVVNATQEEFVGGNLISENTVFWRLRSSSYLYFGEGSKLYFYDVNTKQVKLYTDFGEGRITHLMEDGDGTRLGVCLDNGTFFLCEAISAEVLSANNPGEVGILHKVTGLGEIVSLAWKWGGYYKL